MIVLSINLSVIQFINKKEREFINFLYIIKTGAVERILSPLSRLHYTELYKSDAEFYTRYIVILIKKYIFVLGIERRDPPEWFLP